MVNVSGQRGTAAESAVVRYLRANGFPQCERRRLRGAEDWGDLTGTPGLCWEVKGGTSAKEALEAARGNSAAITKWLGETERERRSSASDVGLLVVQRRGTGDAGRWWTIMDARVMAGLILGGPDALVRGQLPAPETPEPVRVELAVVVRWLRAIGYGEPLEAAA